MIKVYYLIREKIYNIWKYIKYPEKLILKIYRYNNYEFAEIVPDKLYLKCLFKINMGEKLNLHRPKTFSEKMQWLKLYDRRPEYTIMADKAMVKKYITEKLGKEFLIPTIGLYENVDEISFDDLPEKFVIKCTHDSGSTFICDKSKKFDIEKIKNELEKKLNTPFHYCSGEWVYKNIKPRIIIEEFISDEKGGCPVDYKFFCFNGVMEIFKIDYNRFTKRVANYYNKDCQLLEIGKVNSIPDPSIKLELPDNYKQMVEIAEELSKNIPFVRVDLYSVGGQIYFGELTFYPSSGMEEFIGNGDVMMGELLILPEKIKGVK